MSKTDYRFPIGNRPEWTADQAIDLLADEENYYSEWVPSKTAYTRLPGDWLIDPRSDHWATDIAWGWQRLPFRHEARSTETVKDILSDLKALVVGRLGLGD